MPKLWLLLCPCGPRFWITLWLARLRKAHSDVNGNTISVKHLIYSNFSWTFLSKGERCIEVIPMWSTNPWDKARPQHRELRALLFSISVWVLGSWVFCAPLPSTDISVNISTDSRSIKYRSICQLIYRLRVGRYVDRDVLVDISTDVYQLSDGWHTDQDICR